MSKGLDPGDVFPDYELPDEQGALHRLSDLQGDDLLVVHLSRGEHCPRERQHHRELLRLQEWLPVAFTQLVSILPNDLHDTYKLKISTGAAWTFLADTELAVQTAHGIDEYTDLHHAATVPHTLVLGPGRVIDRAYCGYWYWGRPSSERLWADLRDLTRRVKADFDPTTDEARAAWQATRATAGGRVA
jgi:peroxiredoxin